MHEIEVDRSKHTNVRHGPVRRSGGSGIKG